MSVPALLSADDEKLLEHVSQLASQGAAGVPGLLSLFQHRSWTVRRAVVSALEGQEEAGLAVLTRALVEERGHEPTLAGIVDALAGASPAVDALVRPLLLHDSAAVLCDVIQIAGRRRDRQALPRLIDLTRHADDNVALAAVEGLGRVGGAEALDELIALASGDNFFRAFPAIEVLGAAREARALPTLQKLLKNPLYAAEAARAIGRIGSLSAVGPLVQALGVAPDALVRVIALSLSAIQDAVSQSLGPSFAVSRAVREHGSPTLRAKVTRALHQAEGADAAALGRLLIWLADEEGVADLVPLLSGSDEVRTLAIEGLSALGALEDERVVAALQQGNSELRAALLPALTAGGVSTAAIASCLTDPLPAVRTLACHALARGTVVSAVPALFELLRDSDLGVVHAAIGAIQALGCTDTERLAMRAARSEDEAERRAALRIVLYFGYAGSLELALEALASGDERARAIALGGITALDDPGVPGVLIASAQHESARTRASAVRALGHGAASPEVEHALEVAVNDPDAWVRYYACQSFGRLRRQAAVPLLIARLQDPAGQVRMAAIEALAAIPGEVAANALAAAASSPSLELQRAAIVGIGTRKDPSLEPIVLRALASLDPAIRMVAASSVAAFSGSEQHLERLAAADSDAGVRYAALELLSSRDDAASTIALVRVLTRDPSSTAALAGLSRGIDARIPTLLDLLSRADDVLARALVGVLSRAESRAARSALDLVFEAPNVPARRATARALGLILDDAAKAALARAAVLDADLEVRRICAAAMA